MKDYGLFRRDFPCWTPGAESAARLVRHPWPTTT